MRTRRLIGVVALAVGVFAFQLGSSPASADIGVCTNCDAVNVDGFGDGYGSLLPGAGSAAPFATDTAGQPSGLTSSDTSLFSATP